MLPSSLKKRAATTAATDCLRIHKRMPCGSLSGRTRSGPNRIQFVWRRPIHTLREAAAATDPKCAYGRSEIAGRPVNFYAVRRWNNRKNRTTRKPTRHPGIDKTKSAITRNRVIRNRFPGVFNSDCPLTCTKIIRILPVLVGPIRIANVQRLVYIFLRLNSMYETSVSPCPRRF